MSADTQNGEPRKPAEVSPRVRRYLEDPGVAERIQRLYEETRLSLQGQKPENDASHLERLRDLEESERYERAAHEEWLTKLPREKQEAYFEFGFLMQSLRGILVRYGQEISEEGPEQFEMAIIDEIFENLRLEVLKDEKTENDRLKVLAIRYSKVRKYIIRAKSFSTKYRGNNFQKHTAHIIKIFESLREEEQDNERCSAIEKGLKGLKRFQEEIGDGDCKIGLEELEKLEACFLQIPELRTVIPHESTMISRLYGERMKSDELEITRQRIKNVASEETTTPEKLQAKAGFLQGEYVANMFPVSKEGDDILVEALSADLLEYIPKDIPRNLREEFRKELKALMIGINKILLHIQTVKDINGFESNSNKNLQFTLLYGIREDLLKLRKVMIDQKKKKPTFELEPASDEIETITCEIVVRESEVLRGTEEGDKDPTEILRERRDIARFGLSHAISKIIERIDALFYKMGGKGSPGPEIKHCCNTSANKLRRSAQLIAGVFNKDPKLTDMFPEVKEDIAEAVRLRKDLYAFYTELSSIAKQIEKQAKMFPKEAEIKDPRHKTMANFVRNQKRSEFNESIKTFKKVIEDYADLVSRMRPADRELVVEAQIEEKELSMGDMAQAIHAFMISLQLIATQEINQRELLKHEDKKNIENAVENLFMSKWLINREEISKEALLRVVTRLMEAVNSLKKAFYRNPGILIKIQKRLNELSEELLDELIKNMYPEDTKEERKRKIKIDKELKKRLLSFLTGAELRLDIAHELF
ncbi:MAG: hypothetical protein GWP15_02275 [Nitrospirae bacterium]|nr:hypothetical protein [Nitrospirota bacterium]